MYAAGRPPPSAATGPRARGRATRINKRTCQITVVVAQLAEEELEMRAASLAASGRRSADQDRAARVAASKDTEEETEAVADEHVEEDGDTPDSSIEAEVVSEEVESSESEPENADETETDSAELESTEDTEPSDEDEKEA